VPRELELKKEKAASSAAVVVGKAREEKYNQPR